MLKEISGEKFCYIKADDVHRRLNSIIDTTVDSSFFKKCEIIVLVGHPSMSGVKKLQLISDSFIINEKRFVMMLGFFKIKKRYMHMFQINKGKLDMLREVIRSSKLSLTDMFDSISFLEKIDEEAIMEIDLKNRYLTFNQKLQNSQLIEFEKYGKLIKNLNS